MFDQTARPSGPSVNARLAWLTAQLSSPSQGPPVGRLARRWVPARFTADGIPVNRRWLAVAAVLIAVAVIVTGAIALFGHRPGAETAPPLPSAKAAGDAPAAAAAKAPLVVSVVGRVLKPGLVTIPPGARVADALTAAGGPQPGTDLTGVNLARRLTDGEQVAVGVPVPAAAGMAAPVGKLDLNTATAEQLDTLPGVGEVMAKRIVDWRSGHGGFTSVEQLREVEGIGESKFKKVRELVSVG
ncbi:competence protein ComEA [Amycolatopsis sp. WAC 01416]|uniref:ComEA family DNA-binding protein n=1 Tax=Amycolatopsis sp. WAC 01416 TaxID=2203196 RepID=UPI000F79105E|nr:ComEA family DNA-binding protein [Amycolatopsis sp. WAC 01416]RSN30457.1 competence protein ComEA [Amycolatopsis sp. WAC 01416]